MTFPNMDAAFWNWTRPSDLQLVTTVVANYETTEMPTVTVPFQGVLEPIHPRKLMVKPENQRRWKWWDLWTTKLLELNNIIIDGENKQYRVMSVIDWSNGRYRQYELVQDPPLNS